MVNLNRIADRMEWLQGRFEATGRPRFERRYDRLEARFGDQLPPPIAPPTPIEQGMAPAPRPALNMNDPRAAGMFATGSTTLPGAPRPGMPAMNFPKPLSAAGYIPLMGGSSSLNTGMFQNQSIGNKFQY